MRGWVTRSLVRPRSLVRETTLWTSKGDRESVSDPLYLIECGESHVPFRKTLAMWLKVTTADVHDKEALDGGVWIIIRRRMWETVRSELSKVLMEDIFNEGGPAKFFDYWRLEKARHHVKQALRAHNPVNWFLSILTHAEKHECLQVDVEHHFLDLCTSFRCRVQQFNPRVYQRSCGVI